MQRVLYAFTDTLYIWFNQTVVIVWIRFKKTSLVKAKYLEITQGYPIYIGDTHLELPEVGTNEILSVWRECRFDIDASYKWRWRNCKFSETDSILTPLWRTQSHEGNPKTLNSNLFIFQVDSTKLDLEGTNTFLQEWLQPQSHARAGHCPRPGYRPVMRDQRKWETQRQVQGWATQQNWPVGLEHRTRKHGESAAFTREDVVPSQIDVGQPNIPNVCGSLLATVPLTQHWYDLCRRWRMERWEEGGFVLLRRWSYD